MEHSYEEIRQATIEALAGIDKDPSPLKVYIKSYRDLSVELSYLLERASGNKSIQRGQVELDGDDAEAFREIFWSLFIQGIITLGHPRGNENFPYFQVTSFGRKILSNENPYFFHDVSGYEKIIRKEIPDIDDTTLIYLKEAVQAYRSGCTLSATVMVGVASEHTFLKLLETVEQNLFWKDKYKNVFELKSILPKVNKFKGILDQYQKELKPEIKESLDTNFMGILELIRSFRNDSGHPTGKIILREQCYINLQLFIPYCKKMYQLIDFFGS